MLFDSLDASCSEDRQEHHVVDPAPALSGEIRNVLAVGAPATSSPAASWRERSSSRSRGSACAASLASSAATQASDAAQASLLLGMFPTGGYTLVEENGALEQLGWKDLCLLTASAWSPIRGLLPILLHL